MDESEQLVEKYLRSLGYKTVVYEPDGNVPPDFLIDGRIAVEARRLNQNVTSSEGHIQGLEELSIPLWHRAKKLLLSLGPSASGETWFVGIDFRRPLEPWQLLEAKIRSALLAFKHAPVRSRATLAVTENLELDVFPAGRAHATFFLLGGNSDDDSGGFVLAEIKKNLKLCISEKERKVAPYRSRYPEWWLVLPDHIGYGVDAEDREVFRKELEVLNTWHKVVLLDPRDHSRAFEI